MYENVQTEMNKLRAVSVQSRHNFAVKNLKSTMPPGRSCNSCGYLEVIAPAHIKEVSRKLVFASTIDFQFSLRTKTHRAQEVRKFGKMGTTTHFSPNIFKMLQGDSIRLVYHNFLAS